MVPKSSVFLVAILLCFAGGCSIISTTKMAGPVEDLFNEFWTWRLSRQYVLSSRKLYAELGMLHALLFATAPTRHILWGAIAARVLLTCSRNCDTISAMRHWRSGFTKGWTFGLSPSSPTRHALNYFYIIECCPYLNVIWDENLFWCSGNLRLVSWPSLLFLQWMAWRDW